MMRNVLEGNVSLCLRQASASSSCCCRFCCHQLRIKIPKQGQLDPQIPFPLFVTNSISFIRYKFHFFFLEIVYLQRNKTVTY